MVDEHRNSYLNARLTLIGPKRWGNLYWFKRETSTYAHSHLIANMIMMLSSYIIVSFRDDNSWKKIGSRKWGKKFFGGKWGNCIILTLNAWQLASLWNPSIKLCVLHVMHCNEINGSPTFASFWRWIISSVIADYHKSNKISSGAQHVLSISYKTNHQTECRSLACRYKSVTTKTMKFCFVRSVLCLNTMLFKLARPCNTWAFLRL